MTAKKQSPWRRSLLGTYASSPGTGLGRSVRTIHLTGDRRIVFNAAVGSASIFGYPAAGTDARIDLQGIGGPPNLPGQNADATAPIGRYVTTPGYVNVDRVSTWPVAPTLTAYGAVAAGLHLWNRLDTANVGRVRVTNLATGAITDWTGEFTRGTTQILSTGDAVFAVRAVTAGAGQTLTTTNAPADAKRPARLRPTRRVYDDAPVSPVMRGLDGQQPLAYYPFQFQRPLTTGALGRGVTSSLQSPVLRGHKLWFPHQTTTYEHELGSTTGTSSNTSGGTYSTAVQTTLITRRLGFMRVSKDGASFVNLCGTVERREGDALLWNDDAGNPEGTLTYGARNSVLIGTTVVADTLAPPARDQAGLAKGASGWSAAGAMPGVLAQGKLLAVCRTHVDRYDLTGKYLDRVACPGGLLVPTGSNAFSNFGWLHQAVAESTSSTTANGVPFDLSSTDALALPVSATAFQITLDAGATWAVYTLQAYPSGQGLPPQGWPYMGTWSGMVPLFLT